MKSGNKTALLMTFEQAEMRDESRTRQMNVMEINISMCTNSQNLCRSKCFAAEGELPLSMCGIYNQDCKMHEERGRANADI